MTRTRALLIAAITPPLLMACAGGADTAYIEAQDARMIQSKASVGDIVLCLKQRLKDDATVVAYPEPGKVDVRVGDGSRSDTRYYYLINLRQAAQGTSVALRTSGEWHPMMSANRVAGIIEDCKPGTARR